MWSGDGGKNRVRDCLNHVHLGVVRGGGWAWHGKGTRYWQGNQRRVTLQWAMPLPLHVDLGVEAGSGARASECASLTITLTLPWRVQTLTYRSMLKPSPKALPAASSASTGRRRGHSSVFHCIPPPPCVLLPLPSNLKRHAYLACNPSLHPKPYRQLDVSAGRQRGHSTPATT